MTRVHLAALLTALLVILAGVAWYSSAADGADAEPLASVGADDDDRPALTAQVTGAADSAKPDESDGDREAGEIKAANAGELAEPAQMAGDDAEAAASKTDNAEEIVSDKMDANSGGPDEAAEADEAEDRAEAQEAADEENEAAKAPPKKRRRSVEVRVIPWGTLYINGRRIGEGTRHKMRLREGRHRMILKQGGKVRAERTVDVTSRSSKIIEIVAR